MKKVIITLTALTFALGLAAAAQAQTVKIPEKPEVKAEQTTPTSVAPQKQETKTGEKVKPVSKEEVKAGEKKVAKKPGKKEKNCKEENKSVTPQVEKK
jgi:uncharacterized low-complexity protein